MQDACCSLATLAEALSNHLRGSEVSLNGAVVRASYSTPGSRSRFRRHAVWPSQVRLLLHTGAFRQSVTIHARGAEEFSGPRTRTEHGETTPVYAGGHQLDECEVWPALPAGRVGCGTGLLRGWRGHPRLEWNPGAGEPRLCSAGWHMPRRTALSHSDHRHAPRPLAPPSPPPLHSPSWCVYGASVFPDSGDIFLRQLPGGFMETSAPQRCMPQMCLDVILRDRT